jgi:N-terminal domain of toast_rack, DUF2154
MRTLLLGLVIAASLSVMSCRLESVPTGEMKRDSVHLDGGGVEAATVELQMAAGELEVNGGASKLVEGDLEYNVPSWQPIVHSSKAGHFARLRIEQPGKGMASGSHVTNRWSLRLSNQIPLTFNIECGAGQAKLNLGDMKLRDVDVSIGAGQINMDLRGHPESDYNVNISGGVGQATVYLPADTAVRAEAHGGIGSIRVEGLEKHGDFWESANYGRAKATIHLKAHGGIGEIRIIGS